MKAKSSFKSISQVAVTLGLTKYSLKASLRNRAGYFFSFVFPLVFVSVFGLIGNSSQATKIGIPDNLDRTNPIYKTVKILADQKDSPIQLVNGSEADLEKQLSKADIASILAPSANQKVPDLSITLVTSNGSPQGKAASENLLRGIISQMNLSATQMPPVFSFTDKEISGRSYNYIDFLLPGQIGFSMLSLATFGVAFSFITLRKTLVLKRMFATAVKPLSFVIAQCLSRSVQAVIQAAVILFVGVWAFHFTLLNGWVSVVNMLVLSFLGILSFLGFGILISNLARDEQTLPVAINIFNLPQMLLAGVFFPIDGMPKWIQFIGNNLPLAYLNTAMRNVSIDGQSLFQVWPYIAGLVAWSTAAYVVAALTFKTE